MPEPLEEAAELEGGGVWAKPMAVAASCEDDCFWPSAELSYLAGGDSAGAAESGEPQAAQRAAPVGFCAKHEGQTMDRHPPRLAKLSASWEGFGNNNRAAAPSATYPAGSTSPPCRALLGCERR